jgi:putative GTP pyrophosphokinase
MKHLYNAAIALLETRLKILDDEFYVKYSHNLIHNLETDIAGIKIVCHYINDVYKMADLLKNQSDLAILKRKDYIQQAKPNGYRSLHLIVSVPVNLSNSIESAAISIQIRTVAMDCWASLEGELHYKPTTTKSITDIKKHLTRCAELIAELDTEMQKIHRGIADY